MREINWPYFATHFSLSLSFPQQILLHWQSSMEERNEAFNSTVLIRNGQVAEVREREGGGRGERDWRNKLERDLALFLKHFWGKGELLQQKT